MSYCQFQPAPLLSPYIDAYWMADSDADETGTTRILPDGCVDIILNGSNTQLIGPMMRFKDIIASPGDRVIGVRFKPAGFPAFYQYASLHELTDEAIPFERSLSPDINKTLRYTTAYLDQYFTDRLRRPGHSLLPIIKDIEAHQGLLDINALAGKHFITARQLERHFKQQVGTTPKAFTNLVRYQHVFPRITNNTAGKSLAEIAFESGYYDHAHLANEVKKYTGKYPSEWC